MDTVNLLEDAAYAMKCNICNKCLSVPPIMAVSVDGSQYKCGRCKDIECKTYNRCSLFENMAKYLLFPCDFKDCKEKIPWGLIDEHEKKCLYRTIQCPLSYQKCNEVVKVSQLEYHFKQKHVDNIEYESSVYDMGIHSNISLLLLVKNEKYFIYITSLDDIFAVTVLSIALPKESVKCCITLSTTDNNFSVSCKNKEIMCYTENQHCYECIRQRCHNKQHPFSQEYSKSTNMNWFTVTLNRDSVMNLLDNPKEYIRYSISITDADNEIGKKNEPKQVQVVDVDPRIYELHEKLLRCPTCQNYMVAPIYSCETGHIICVACKEKLEECPTCKAKIGGTRSYALEELGEKAVVPCIYTEEGCNFIGNAHQVIQHEIDCACASSASETV